MRGSFTEGHVLLKEFAHQKKVVEILLVLSKIRMSSVSLNRQLYLFLEILGFLRTKSMIMCFSAENTWFYFFKNLNLVIPEIIKVYRFQAQLVHYRSVSASFNVQQIASFFARDGNLHRDLQPDNMQRVLNGMSSSNPSPQGSGIYVEEKAKRSQEPELVDDYKVTASPRHNWADAL